MILFFFYTSKSFSPLNLFCVISLLLPLLNWLKCALYDYSLPLIEYHLNTLPPTFPISSHLMKGC